LREVLVGEGKGWTWLGWWLPDEIYEEVLGDADRGA
jgi:hypothetical protein